MPKKTNPDLTLSVALTSLGFAFVLFEGPLAPFDWGVSEIIGAKKNDSALRRIQTIIERYHPDTLVIENFSAQRSERLRALSLGLRHMAVASGMNVCHYDRAAIRRCFASVGARTKYEIAQAIAREIPEIGYRLPPIRKIWMNEDHRQSLFDAASLGITYFQCRSISLEADNK
jgi:hypothetical protein